MPEQNRDMPLTLAQHFGLDEIGFTLVRPHQFAHVIIDVQRTFCDPTFGTRGTPKTHEIAGRIAALTPAFRNAGLPTYVVYFSKDNATLENAMGGLHLLKAAAGDTIVRKNLNSAFQGSNLGQLLEQAGVKTLIVSGFNISSCVRETVMDALKEKFNVWIMSDCVGNDQGNQGLPDIDLQAMEVKGARLTTAIGAITELAQHAAGPT